MFNNVKLVLHFSVYQDVSGLLLIYSEYSSAEQTMCQRVMMGHGSDGSTNLNGSCGSRVIVVKKIHD